MKGKTLGVLGFLVLAAVLVGGGIYMNGDQLQGRFSNLGVSQNMKSLNVKDEGSEYKGMDGTQFGSDIDFDASKQFQYFNFDNFITSTATLDPTSDEKVIVGHMILSFTDSYDAKHSGETVDVTFTNITALSAADDSSLVNFNYWAGDDGFGVDMVASNTYYSEEGQAGKIVGIDPSEGDYAVEFWVIPSELNYDLFDPSDAGDMYLAIRDVYMQHGYMDGNYSFIGQYPGENDDMRFSFADMVEVNGIQFFRSLMEFSAL